MAEDNTVPETLEEKLDKVGRGVERLLVKLFGDVEGETPTGRLPMLEERQKDHEKRLRSLERVALRVGGAIGLLGMIAGLCEAAAHLASAVKH